MQSTYLKLPTVSKQSSVFRQELSGLNAYEKHIKFVNEYTKFYGDSQQHQQPQRPAVSEVDILKQNHQFLREDSNSSSTWEHRIAKKYYDKLFKEFAITDLSRYKEGKVALRWRTKREVVGGIGQFTCANLKCTHREPYMPSNPAANFVHPSGKKNHQPDLRSWEVNFAYREGGEHKNALVKIRLCPECSYMLNYKKMKEKEQEAVAEREKEAVELKRKRKDKKSKKKRSSAQSDSASDDETKKKKSRNSSKKKRHDGDDDDAADKDSSEESDGGESVQEPSTASTSAPAASLAAQIWGAPQTLETEKSKDEEMDDFFNDIFNQE